MPGTPTASSDSQPLHQAIDLSADRIVGASPQQTSEPLDFTGPTLIVLAAGKGTRFGNQPKCIQPVAGTPIARHAIDGFAVKPDSPATDPSTGTHASTICVVGHKWDTVVDALGSDPIYVKSDNPVGGTAYATYEALSVPGLLDANPIVVITMGDRIVPAATVRKLLNAHTGGDSTYSVVEGDLTFLTAEYAPPRNQGKGRIARDSTGSVTAIVEERDILAMPDGPERTSLLNLTEGNCPLYAARARTLQSHLAALTNDNAQRQYYLTDIVASIARTGGLIRTITTRPGDPEYDLLTSDVTRPEDLERLEVIVEGKPGLLGE